MDTPALPDDFYKTIAEHSIDLISVMRIDGLVLYESPSVERILGYTRDELVGTNALGRIHPADLSHVVGLIAEGKLHHEKQYTTRVRSRHKDGSWRWLDITAQLLTGSPGVGLGILVQGRDVTAQKAAEDELKDSEERFRLLFDISQEGFAIHDQGVIVYANKTMADMYGMTVAEMIGQHGLDHVTEASRKAVMDTWATNSNKPLEITGIKKDGSEFSMVTHGMPVTYRGKAMRIFSARDVTAERMVTSQLKLKSDELEKQLVALERTNELMIGRELKMKELKLRLSELEKKQQDSS